MKIVVAEAMKAFLKIFCIYSLCFTFVFVTKKKDYPIRVVFFAKKYGKLFSFDFVIESTIYLIELVPSVIFVSMFR